MEYQSSPATMKNQQATPSPQSSTPSRSQSSSSSTPSKSRAKATRRPKKSKGEPREPQHSWTRFEVHAVLALICKGEHLWTKRSGDWLRFATKLNTALNGRGKNYMSDVSVREVRAFVAHLERRSKAGLRFIERQGPPLRLTRAQKRVFERQLDFDGSVEEWTVGGRRERVAERRRCLRGRHRHLDDDGDRTPRWVRDPWGARRERPDEREERLAREQRVAETDARRLREELAGPQPLLWLDGGIREDGGETASPAKDAEVARRSSPQRDVEMEDRDKVIEPVKGGVSDRLSPPEKNSRSERGRANIVAASKGKEIDRHAPPPPDKTDEVDRYIPNEKQRVAGRYTSHKSRRVDRMDHEDYEHKRERTDDRGEKSDKSSRQAAPIQQTPRSPLSDPYDDKPPTPTPRGRQRQRRSPPVQRDGTVAKRPLPTGDDDPFVDDSNAPSPFGRRQLLGPSPYRLPSPQVADHSQRHGPVPQQSGPSAPPTFHEYFDQQPRLRDMPRHHGSGAGRINVNVMSGGGWDAPAPPPPPSRDMKMELDMYMSMGTNGHAESHMAHFNREMQQQPYPSAPTPQGHSHHHHRPAPPQSPAAGYTPRGHGYSHGPAPSPVPQSFAPSPNYYAGADAGGYIPQSPRHFQPQPQYPLPGGGWGDVVGGGGGGRQTPMHMHMPTPDQPYYPLPHSSYGSTANPAPNSSSTSPARHDDFGYEHRHQYQRREQNAGDRWGRGV